MLRLIILFFTLFFTSLANEYELGVDCLILEDENSIICKYTHQRVEYDKTVTLHWIDPKGEVSRQRDMIIPAQHGSIYDFRYIHGRQKGRWKVEVVDGEAVYETHFELQ